MDQVRKYRHEKLLTEEVGDQYIWCGGIFENSLPHNAQKNALTLYPL